MLDPFKYLDIQETEIRAKHKSIIYLDKNDLKEFLTEYQDRFDIPGVVNIYIPSEENEVALVTPYDVIGVIKSDDYSETREFYQIVYEPGDLIIEQKYVSTETNLKLLSWMLDGKIKYVDSPEALVNLLHLSLPAADLVHLELLYSNIFRDNETGEPARFTGSYKNSHQVGVTKLGQTDSWLSAITFQHIQKGVEKALVHGQDAKMNPIEKVLTEDFKNL